MPLSMVAILDEIDGADVATLDLYEAEERARRDRGRMKVLHAIAERRRVLAEGD